MKLHDTQVKRITREIEKISRGLDKLTAKIEGPLKELVRVASQLLPTEEQEDGTVQLKEKN